MEEPVGRRAARFFSFQWEGVESLSSSPTLQSVLLPIYAWFAKLIGGVERIEAPSDLGEIEVFLERKRSSNAIISSTLEELEERLKDCNYRNRAMQDVFRYQSSQAEPELSPLERHALLCRQLRMAAACHRSELDFSSMLSEIFSTTYQITGAESLQLIVLDSTRGQEWWVSGVNGGTRQAIGRGRNAGNMTAKMSLVVDKTVALLVANEGMTRFSHWDDEALRVGAREIAAAIKKESVALNIYRENWGKDDFLTHSSAIPPLLSLFGEENDISIASLDGESFNLLDEDHGPVGFLEEMLTWNFDVFSKSPKELEYYIVDVYKASGLATRFDISDGALRRFASNIRLAYHDNPFHNFYHGFSVFQVTYLLMKEAGVSKLLCDTDLLAGITAALCHDVDHPGVSNDFLTHAESPLALIYNDVSVLENHHCRTTFEIVCGDEHGIFASLTEVEMTAVRRSMVSAIMATDMRFHGSYVSRLKTVAEAFKSCPGQGVPLDREKEQDRQLLLDVLVHCADLSGQVLKPTLARSWGERVLTEFRNQSIIEGKQGMPVAPFMLGLDCPLKRATTQKNFIEFVVSPLWRAFADVFPDLEFCSDQLSVNLRAHASDEDNLKNAQGVLCP